MAEIFSPIRGRTQESPGAREHPGARRVSLGKLALAKKAKCFTAPPPHIPEIHTFDLGTVGRLSLCHFAVCLGGRVCRDDGRR